MNRIIYLFWKFYVKWKYGFYPKPSYLFRSLRNLILAKMYLLFGIDKFVFRGVDIAVTYRCNFNCEHCYAKRLIDKGRERLTLSDYHKICREVMDLGGVTFSLQGGEVFLHPEWKKIIKVLKPELNHIVITTNGSLLTEETVKTMKNLHVDTIYFSVDSGIPEEHDTFRKRKGNYQQIMRAIKWCRKHGLKVVINTCVSKYNVGTEGLERLLEFSHKNRYMICLILARPLGNWDGNYEALLSEKDMEKVNEYLRRYPFAQRDNNNNYGKTGCQAAKEYLYITEYGDVCPCPMTHIVLGNVKHESLREIRERALRTKWWNKYHEKCLTARNKEFMNRYYPLIQKKPLIPLKEFMEDED